MKKTEESKSSQSLSLKNYSKKSKPKTSVSKQIEIEYHKVFDKPLPKATVITGGGGGPGGPPLVRRRDKITVWWYRSRWYKLLTKRPAHVTLGKSLKKKKETKMKDKIEQMYNRAMVFVAYVAVVAVFSYAGYVRYPADPVIAVGAGILGAIFASILLKGRF